MAHSSDRTFQDPAVRAVFETYPESVRSRLMAVRSIIFETAQRTKGVGTIEETLKWGQPSYLTPSTKSGSTIRIDHIGGSSDRYAIFFHCQTNLVETFRDLYPGEMNYVENRSIEFEANAPLPEKALAHCIAMGLTYHLRKKAPQPVGGFSG